MISTYETKITAPLCIDCYNDLLSAGGKLWPCVKDVVEVNLLDNLRPNVATAREAERMALDCFVDQEPHRHADRAPSGGPS